MDDHYGRALSRRRRRLAGAIAGPLLLLALAGALLGYSYE